jgi:hypothetical protein
MALNIGEKIGEGGYRECWEVLNTNLCAKSLKKKITKSYWGKINIYFSSTLYTRLKFGICDFNQWEYKIFKSLPKELHDYFPRNLQMKEDLLIMERPRDYDGAYSQTVGEMGSVSNVAFWIHVNKIVEILLVRQLFLLDVFYRGNNILVRKISPQEWRPVLTDVKRMGRSTYPFQPLLFSQKEQQKKFCRRLERFRATYQKGRP